LRTASFIVLLSIRSAYAYRLTATEPRAVLTQLGELVKSLLHRRRL